MMRESQFVPLTAAPFFSGLPGVAITAFFAKTLIASHAPPSGSTARMRFSVARDGMTPHFLHLWRYCGCTLASSNRP